MLMIHTIADGIRTLYQTSSGAMQGFLLLIICCTATAQDPQQEPTPEDTTARAHQHGSFVWSGGRTTLGAMIDRLQASGGPTTTAGDVDRHSEAEIDFIDGTYWDGILAVCAAFDLQLSDPGPADIHIHEVNGHPLALSCGPVVLAKGPATHRSSHGSGPLLLEVLEAGLLSTRDQRQEHHRMIGTYRLRGLPRWQHQAVHIPDMQWRQARAANASAIPLDLTLFRATAGNSTNVLALQLEDPHHQAVRLWADMQLAFIDVRSVIARVTEGAQHDLMLGSVPIQVLLTAAAEPDDLAELRIRLPHDRVITDSLAIVILDGQQRQINFQHSDPSNTLRSGDHITLVYSIASNILPDTQYRFGLTGRYTLDRWHVPLTLDLRLR